MEILIVFWVMFALISGYMANSRGRNCIDGFFAGLLFGLFTVIYYLIVGDTLELRLKKTKDIEKKLNV